MFQQNRLNENKIKNTFEYIPVETRVGLQTTHKTFKNLIKFKVFLYSTIIKHSKMKTN